MLKLELVQLKNIQQTICYGRKSYKKPVGFHEKSKDMKYCKVQINTVYYEK